METLRELFEAGLARPKARHVRWRDASKTWRSLSTEEVRERVDAAGRGLAALGLRPGDRVGLISQNSERWMLSDFAMACTGLVNVPLYPTLTPEQVRFILDDSGARVLIVEDVEQLDRLRRELRDAGLLRVVLLRDEGETPKDVLTWTELLESGRAADPVEHVPQADELASLIYTSGTTGPPKGVMLTHLNLVSNALGCLEAIDLSRVPQQLNLSLLPLCHIFQRLVDYFLWLGHAEVAYCPNALFAAEYLKEVKPTFTAAVPRLFEKVRAGFLARIARAEPKKKRLADWALGVGREHFQAWYRDGACNGRRGPWLSLKHAVADRLVLKKVREVFGGRIDMCFSGGAALPPDVHEFYRTIGLNILPGYGLTEASPVLATNRPETMGLGTVGPPLPNVDLKVSEEGELLARGPNVMKGYWNREEETAATIVDGWLLTGDLAGIDERGFVSITGRKKEIIVLSTGKNISPQVVEDCLGRSELVLQAVVVGDDRKHVSALVAPNLDTLRAALEARGLTPGDDEQMLRCREAEQELLASFESCVSALAPFERPKRVAVLPRELSQEHGELTPTLKYKRRAILENWGDQVDALYIRPGKKAKESS
jgi:long-chain acyl-CoA synthetase